MTEPPGRIISKIPKNPVITANHRRQPTFSPKRGWASAVMNSGPANAIATASVSGKYFRPIINMKHIFQLTKFFIN